MKVKELIEKLSGLNPDAEVKVINAEHCRADFSISWVNEGEWNGVERTVEEEKLIVTTVYIEPDNSVCDDEDCYDDCCDGCVDECCGEELAEEYSKPASSKKFSEENYLKS